MVLKVLKRLGRRAARWLRDNGIFALLIISLAIVVISGSVRPAPVPDPTAAQFAQADTVVKAYFDDTCQRLAQRVANCDLRIFGHFDAGDGRTLVAVYLTATDRLTDTERNLNGIATVVDGQMVNLE